MSFTIRQERHIPEIDSLVRLYFHDQTGAQLVTVSNQDENKAFGITFPTPPASSNGIAHILEHCVLSGSRKYPVKEPFVELVKGSFKTFLNAMTFSDRTVYPVASTNLQDYYNLVDVYMDAVFHPLISEDTLLQEGWHYELASPHTPLSIKGVVFNEMKGEYSSPDRLSYEYSQRSLFPDNAYSFDSGGDPAVIPSLTYSEFRAFHEKYYHPSNAFVWFYGDDPEERRLKLLDPLLAEFTQRPADSLVQPQPRWAEPRHVLFHYDSADSPDAKSFLTANWLLDERSDVLTELGLSILSHILTGTPGSPLRKALMESGLGEDLAGVGFVEDLRQPYYSTGMKGVASPDLPKVEGLILETLAGLASRGIDPGTVAASINTIEFRLREQNTGQFPRGLALMFAALSRWMYGGDPFDALSFEGPLQAIKEKVCSEEEREEVPPQCFFEKLIQRFLVDNPHRVTVTLKPDPDEGRRRAAEEEARLARTRELMSETELRSLVDTAAELRHLQETPDSPEALATLPYLKLADLDPLIKTIPIEVAQPDRGVGKVLYHDLPTHGIVYLDLGFNLRTLAPDLLPFAGFFGRLLLETGTRSEDYAQLSQRIGRETGGIWPSAFTAASPTGNQAALWFFLRGKATVAKTGSLMDILRDVLLTARLDNAERFRQIVLEEKAGLEAALVPSGHGLVNSRLHARLSENGWASEQMGGIEQLFFLRRLAGAIDNDWVAVLDKLEAVRSLLISRKTLLANVTLEASAQDEVLTHLEKLIQSLPAVPAELHSFPPLNAALGERANEGLTIPAQVNYVGKGFNLFANGYKLQGSALVATRYLRASYMWQKVRVEGGAYGGYSLLDPHSGTFTFLSYRDPNITATLEAYDGAPAFLRSLELSDSELTKAIIGTVSDIDAYLLPDAKGWTSMSRHLIGYTDEMRQRLRDEILATTPKDFRSFGEALERAARSAEIVVLGPAQAIEQANAGRPGWLQVNRVI
jgi:Zn-dependent M16 (insulinase) family peptidase